MNADFASSERVSGCNEERRRCSRRGSPPNGILIVDKPAGTTSFDAVAKVKRWLTLDKAGHCGTLDPFATGVLVICLNQATRIADQLLVQDKVYRFAVHLGIETDTLDNTGNVVCAYDGAPSSLEDVQKAVETFRGRCLQRVPRFAAVKWNGNRLYKLARHGVHVELPPREVFIHTLDLIAYEWPEAVLEARCSKGTYIRQLAADIGSALGCGAHVRELRRLASGPFGIDQADPLDGVEAISQGDASALEIIPVNEALSHMQAVRIDDAGLLKAITDGHLDSAWEYEQRNRLSVAEGPVRLVGGENRLVALWWPWAEGKEQRKLRVFK